MTGAGPVHVFVLIDALGWSYLRNREFLDDLLPHRVPLRTVLGYSSGAIPTILTGEPPARHGHWNLFYYDPAGSPFRWMRPLRFLPDRMLDHRVTRKLVKELGRRVLGLGPLFECCVSPRLLPWFNWVEKRNIYECGGISGASSIFDRLERDGVAYRVYSYHRWRDEEILDQAIRDLEDRRATFFFLYLSEIDRLLHDHCEEMDVIEVRLRWYAQRLRRVFDAARRIDSDARLTICSDHGMTPVTHHHDLVREIETLGWAMPNDYLAVYDSTMARFWFFENRARREITRRLEDLDCGRMLSDEESRELGILFPDRRYGELIFLMIPGWLISGSGFNGRGWMPAGMHGYHPDDARSDAIFLSSHEPATPVKTIADVFRHMATSAGTA